MERYNKNWFKPVKTEWDYEPTNLNAAIIGGFISAIILICIL